MAHFLALRVKMHKITLNEVKEKYPQYYDDVCKELGV